MTEKVAESKALSAWPARRRRLDAGDPGSGYFL